MDTEEDLQGSQAPKGSQQKHRVEEEYLEHFTLKR